MASTYSPNLRIELITTGEQSNTWGNTTNSNLGTLIEQAISGLASVDVTAANVTLSALNGATDQARQMIIVATGTPGVTRTITAPAVNKIYVVFNNSNASLSFIASGGTGVTIIAGAKKYVYCDGVNFYEAINALALTSGTIDGVAIGATSASTGKFTTVQSTVATGTAPFIVASTTAVANLTASNVTTNANLTGAVTSVGNASSLGSFTSAQLATALTDETGTGVAVFATSPTLVTPILGTPTSGTLTSCTGLPLTTGVTGTLPAANGGTGVSNASTITLAGNVTHAGAFASTLTVTGATTLTLPRTGTLLSSTTAPAANPVTGTPTSSNFLRGDGTWATPPTGPGGTVTSVTGTAPVVSSGGTTPVISMAAATGSVNGYLTSTDWTTFNNKYTAGGALGTPASGTLTNCTGTASGLTAGAVTNGAYTNVSNTFTVKQYIGATPPVGSSYGSYIRTAIAAEFAATIANDATTAGSATLGITSNAASALMCAFYYGNSITAIGTFVGSISSTTTSVAYNTTSDYRLKENVVPVSNAINRVKGLRPVRFDWVADTSQKTVDGFLAHEAQEVVPEAVTGSKDAVKADGTPDYQGIDQAKLVPLLTAALQEAITRIEALEARLA